MTELPTSGNPSEATFDGKTSTELMALLETTTDSERRFRALVGLGTLLSPPELVPCLISGTEDADSAVVAYSARQLGLLSTDPQVVILDRIATRLTELLMHDDPDVRFEAARALVRGEQFHPQISEVLARFLEDPETQPVMIAAVVRTLAAIRPPSPVLATYWPLLRENSHEEVREALADAAIKWGSSAVAWVPDLLNMLDDEDPFVREHAAHALAAIGLASEEILGALKTATEDEDEECASAAKTALQKLTGRT